MCKLNRSHRYSTIPVEIFYCQSNRLNILLPKLLTDVLDVMKTTINKLSLIGKKEDEL